MVLSGSALLQECNIIGAVLAVSLTSCFDLSVADTHTGTVQLAAVALVFAVWMKLTATVAAPKAAVAAPEAAVAAPKYAGFLLSPEEEA